MIWWKSLAASRQSKQRLYFYSANNFFSETLSKSQRKNEIRNKKSILRRNDVLKIKLIGFRSLSLHTTTLTALTIATNTSLNWILCLCCCCCCCVLFVVAFICSVTALYSVWCCVLVLMLMRTQTRTRCVYVILVCCVLLPLILWLSFCVFEFDFDQRTYHNTQAI